MSELTAIPLCVVKGCEKPYKKRGAKGMCSMHYARWSRHGDPGVVKQPQRTSRGICVIEGCEKRDHGSHGLCAMHYTRVKRHGDSSANFGSVGDEAGYSAVHARLRKSKGPASVQECAHCSGPAQEWAYDNADPNERVSRDALLYSTDESHYVALCKPCHRRFDISVLTVELVGMVHSACAAGVSQRAIGRALGISQQTVCNIVRGRTWMAQS